LSRLKWFSLILLFSAGIFYTFGNIKSKDALTNGTQRDIYITQVGLILILVYVTISGVSGVYSEYLLKKDYGDSIYLQNIYIYMYGGIFNFIGLFVEIRLKNGKFAEINSLLAHSFNGFNVYTILIILTQVSAGFIMSLVIKFSNNITRLFVISSSIVVTTTLSFLLFSIQLNMFFYASFVAIFVALYIYNIY
jgi:hypothetical protein